MIPTWRLATFHLPTQPRSRPSPSRSSNGFWFRRVLYPRMLSNAITSWTGAALPIR